LSEQNKFQIGDTVTWTSQAGGNAKTKTGMIVFIIPAGKLIRDIVFGEQGALYESWTLHHLGIFSSRDHESYLIQVGKSKRLYWPLVKYLEKAETSLPSVNLPYNARKREPWEIDEYDEQY